VVHKRSGTRQPLLAITQSNRGVDSVGQISIARLRQLTDYDLDHRIVVEIRVGVTKPRLNGVTRSLHMMGDQSNDQEAITVLGSDLRRLAESIGVRSATPT